MHRPALVDVAVHVVRVHTGVAQLQQVEQHAVVLVDRGRARVHRHLRLGLQCRHDVGRQHVRRQDVVERAEGVGDGHAPSRRARPLDPPHEGHDVGLVDGHPATAVRRQRRHDPLHVAGEDVGRAGPQPELLAEPERMGEVVQRDDGLQAALRHTWRGSRRSARARRHRKHRAAARAAPTPPRVGRRCSRWRRRGRAPPRGDARSRRPARNGRPCRRPPRRPSCCGARRRR